MPLRYWKGDKDFGLSPETSVQEKANEAAEWRGVMARWKRILARGLEDAMQLLYPPRCLFCQRVLPWPDRVGICTNCHPEEYYLPEPGCRQCGRPVSRQGALCQNCSLHHIQIPGKSLFVYDGAVQEAIHRFKYDGQKAYGKVFASCMAKVLWPPGGEATKEPTIVTPVPLHAERYHGRGYNQAEVLAKEFAEQTGCVMRKLLVRVRNTDPQNALSATARKKNLQDAFTAVEDQAVGRHIIVMDDIYTSGSTIEACGEALRRVYPDVEIRFMTIAMKV